jgi:hypothetical protein
MNLADLKKSITEMSNDELTALVTNLRTRRRRTNQPAAKKPKTTSILKLNLDAIGEDSLGALIELLEAKHATTDTAS